MTGTTAARSPSREVIQRGWIEVETTAAIAGRSIPITPSTIATATADTDRSTAAAKLIGKPIARLSDAAMTSDTENTHEAAAAFDIISTTSVSERTSGG